MTSDFLIIGGGVIGMSVAREIALRGLGKVMLVDKGLVGSEASHAAAGMLAAQAESERARVGCEERSCWLLQSPRVILSKLHVATVLAADRIQGLGNLAQRARADGVH